MNIEERFIAYCRIDTQSDPANSDVTPSTQKQFDLAEVLRKELIELGLEMLSWMSTAMYMDGCHPIRTTKYRQSALLHIWIQHLTIQVLVSIHVSLHAMTVRILS